MNRREYGPSDLRAPTTEWERYYDGLLPDSPGTFYNPEDPALTVTKPSDPAYSLLLDSHTSIPVPGLYRSHCYICRDPEFAQMGLPLCYACSACGGHVAADETVCEDCGTDAQEVYAAEMLRLDTKMSYYFGSRRFGWTFGAPFGTKCFFAPRDPDEAAPCPY